MNKTLKVLLIIILIALVLRVFVVIEVPRTMGDDEAEYLLLAKGMVSAGRYGFATDYSMTSWNGIVIFDDEHMHLAKEHGIRPPFYPLTVAAFFKVFGISENTSVIPNIIFGTLIIILTFLIGLKIFDRSVALLSSVFLITEKNMLAYSVVGLTEVEFIFFSLVSIYFFFSCFENKNRGKIIVSALFLGLAFLTRYEAVLIGIAYVIYFVYKERLAWIKDKNILVAIVILFLTISPWLYRNYLVFGNPIDIGYATGEALSTSAESMSSMTYRVSNKMIGYLISLSIYAITPTLVMLGLAGAVFCIFEKNEKRDFLKFISLLFLIYLVFFAFTQTWTMRYFYIFIPFVSLFASYCLIRIYSLIRAEDEIKAKVVVGIMILTVLGGSSWLAVEEIRGDKTPIYTEGFSIYEENGEWIKNNLPKDSIIITNHWMESFYSNRCCYIMDNISDLDRAIEDCEKWNLSVYLDLDGYLIWGACKEELIRKIINENPDIEFININKGHTIFMVEKE